MRIVMTGATAGIGFQAALRLQAEGHSLIVGARRPDRAPKALAAQTALLPLDLADLNSVRSFATAVEAVGPFDALLLNAGLQVVSDQRSAQGYELTFAANHLAHYLLARRLAPRLNTGGRLILTASGTHDPAERTGMRAPLHADADRLAHPETDPKRDKDQGRAVRRAYSTSKLCNVMTARELARRMAESRPDLMIAAFDPGFTPGTGLARDYPGPIGFIFRWLGPLVFRGPRVSTPANSGGLLAAMATEGQYQTARGDYFVVRGLGVLEQRPPSTLAQDPAACARLWDDSERLIGTLT